MVEYKECENCGEIIEIKIATKGSRKGKPIKIHENKKFCSIVCLNEWQKKVSWEDRIGEERAKEIRKERSDQVSGDKNPSKDPNVAKKISKSMKEYLKENPRMGENNPFFGKEHSDEYKKWASTSRKGKRSYDDDGYLKQKQNTPKKENHPNWNGGTSYGSYCPKFDSKLKETIKLRDNGVCQICGDVGIQLHIHHIDYDKKNSDERNLITLCNFCHGKTNYKRESWLRFFEPIMEEKYKK